MKCKGFKGFSTAMSPKLADLNFKATTKHQVLKRLYKLAKEAEQIEQLRIRILQQFKKVGPRLKKYWRLAAAMKNARKYILNAVELSSEIKPPYALTQFAPILEEAIGTVDEALRILETSRRFIVGHEIPFEGKQKRLSGHSSKQEVTEAHIKLLMEPTMPWENKFHPGRGAGISELTHRYAPKHLRTQGANHWLILQAESFLQEKTTAEQTLRLTIIKELFVSAFGEYIEIGKIKAVVHQANREKRPKP
jgi:hypothetical protein